MSLQWKINLILVVALTGLGLAIYGVEQRIVRPSFVALEEASARDDMTRCIDAINAEVERLASLCSDWASSEDAYRFSGNKNAAFIKANLVADSFKNNHLDFLAIINEKQQTVWQGRADRDKGEVFDATNLTKEVLAAPGIRPKAEAGAVVSGVILTSAGPMLVCSRPILTSDNKGPAHGVMIMGRFFNAQEIAALGERTRVNVKIWSVQDPSLPQEERDILHTLLFKRLSIRRDNPKLVQISETYPNIEGLATLYLRADIPAQIRSRGEEAVWWAVMAAIATGAGIVTFMWVVLNGEVMRPLTKVTQHAKKLAASDDLTAKLNMQRSDEIGALANEFDRMVEQLAKSRANFVDSAHKAGMAEIASEVLHNVGNALNTVNVAAQTMEERLRTSKVDGLNKATKMLGEHKGDLSTFLATDPRGGKLVDYLIGLADVFAAEQQAQLEDLNKLQSRVEHIKDVIAVQQTIATHTELIQNVDLTQVLDDIVAMHKDQLSRYNIDVERQIENLPQVLANQSKLVQVLVNLVKNAIESISQARPEAGKLTIRVFAADECHVGIEITDTGGGIDPANLAKLFSSGFTTKKTGHGIGLHFCANAIKAMGGGINVRSDGIGKGATFAIRLPMSRKEQTV